MRKVLAIALLVIASLSACEKDEPVQNAVIKGQVMHHSWFIPYSTVYLKENTLDFPGYDEAVYDKQVEANQFGEYAFRELSSGNYFIMAKGYDSLISEPIRGGFEAVVNNNLEIVVVDVPVVETSHE